MVQLLRSLKLLERVGLVAGVLYSTFRFVLWVIRVLGDVDFALARAEDPGWLKDVVFWLLAPPEWIVVPSLLAALVLISVPLLIAQRRIERTKTEQLGNVGDRADWERELVALGGQHNQKYWKALHESFDIIAQGLTWLIPENLESIIDRTDWPPPIGDSEDAYDWPVLYMMIEGLEMGGYGFDAKREQELIERLEAPRQAWKLFFTEAANKLLGNDSYREFFLNKIAKNNRRELMLDAWWSYVKTKILHERVPDKDEPWVRLAECIVSEIDSELDITPRFVGVRHVLDVVNNGPERTLRAEIKWIGGSRLSPMFTNPGKAIWLYADDERYSTEMLSGEHDLILLGVVHGKVSPDVSIDELLKMSPEDRDVIESVSVPVYVPGQGAYRVASTEWRTRGEDLPLEVEVEVMVTAKPGLRGGPMRKRYRLGTHGISKIRQ